MTTGNELRRERRMAEVTAVDLGKQLGMTRQRVHQIEARPSVTDERADQWRRGIETVVASREEVAS